MKNQNKTNASLTQIADISVAGKELSEEHLRIATGGLGIFGGSIAVTTNKTTYNATTICHFDSYCKVVQDAADTGTDTMYW